MDFSVLEDMFDEMDQDELEFDLKRKSNHRKWTPKNEYNVSLLALKVYEKCRSLFLTDHELVDLFVETTQDWYTSKNNHLFGWKEEVRIELMRYLNGKETDDESYELLYVLNIFVLEWVGPEGMFQILSSTKPAPESNAMLFLKIKERLVQAIKASDNDAKNAIRALLSKLQTSGQETDEAVISSAKMLIKQNEEEIETRHGRVKLADGSIREVSVTGQENYISHLNAEIVVLKEFLPSFLSADKIKEVLVLSSNKIQIDAAKNAGAAVGVAMRILKPIGAVEGNTVKDVVASIYGSHSSAENAN